jgi:hypothetical protein
VISLQRLLLIYINAQKYKISYGMMGKKDASNCVARDNKGHETI